MMGNAMYGFVDNLASNCPVHMQRREKTPRGDWLVGVLVGSAPCKEATMRLRASLAASSRRSPLWGFAYGGRACRNCYNAWRRNTR